MLVSTIKGPTSHSNYDFPTPGGPIHLPFKFHEFGVSLPKKFEGKQKTIKKRNNFPRFPSLPLGLLVDEVDSDRVLPGVEVVERVVFIPEQGYIFTSSIYS